MLEIKQGSRKLCLLSWGFRCKDLPPAGRHSAVITAQDDGLRKKKNDNSVEEKRGDELFLQFSVGTGGVG